MARPVAGAYPCALRAWESDGRETIVEVGFPPGFSRDGLVAADVVEKFRANTSQTANLNQEHVIQAALSLDRASSLDDLLRTREVDIQ